MTDTTALETTRADSTDEGDGSGLSDGGERSLQPLLHDSTVILRAPTQAWSAPDGDMGSSPIHGVYHGDTRLVSTLRLAADGSEREAVNVAPRGADSAVFVSLLRGLDDAGADPRVRLERRRDVTAGGLVETVSVVSRVGHRIETRLSIEIEPDFSSMQEVKSGSLSRRSWSVEDITDGIQVSSGTASVRVTAPGAVVVATDTTIRVEWPIDVSPHTVESRTLTLDLDDALVVAAPRRPSGWRSIGGAEDSVLDPRLERWMSVALDDLDALRLVLPDHPDDEFLAAGAPWFFTLFGRDSLWAARFLLPVSTELAASTLRVLARLQGDRDDPQSAQQPGKIMHELRSETFSIPGEKITLPPVYYGTVDATPLWVTLLADAHAAGLADDSVTELVPALRRCLEWIVESGDNDGDGFLDYVDHTGHGLSNQGWKDSGDSIQWRDGGLAEGPIALCEVQGYAYEAAMAGARLLEAFGDENDDPDALRAWAGQLKRRFAESYWVETPDGRYPAVALDARKRPVDSLTSNIGHLLGTGILEPEEESAVASLLVDTSMSSGFGLRTMSTWAAGYWPLSYHGGSVWTHDTAIAVLGLARTGHHDEAQTLANGLLAAAERFDFRLPELYSGESSAEFSTPTPYPAACRPQAWSAAAAFAVATALGLTL